MAICRRRLPIYRVPVVRIGGHPHPDQTYRATRDRRSSLGSDGPAQLRSDQLTRKWSFGIATLTSAKARSRPALTNRDGTLERQTIKGFLGIESSDDGLAFRVDVDADHGSAIWTIPYKHAIWLAQAILEISPVAVGRQTAGGAVEGTNLVGERLNVERTRVLVKVRSDHAAISAQGVWSSDQTPGTTILMVDQSIAADLVEQLGAFLVSAQALSRPS
ncbi:hypothetical protein ACVIHD_002453 [Bradyrhizobium embrapense]